MEEQENNTDQINNVPKKEKNNSGIVLISIVILIIGMFAGAYFYTKGYGLSGMFADANEDNGEMIKFDNHTFFKEDGLWRFFIDVEGKTKYKVSLHYNPYEVIDIPVINNGSRIFDKSDSMYIAMDPEQEYKNTSYFVMASAEISRNLVSTFGKTPIGACYENYDPVICEDRPVVDCNENTTIPIIFIKENTENYVEFISDNCVVINGHDEGIVKGAERLLYRWLAILK